jgi:KUP system potassium uptake protein
VISGSFSLTRQAIQLGLLPQLDVFQTSVQARGQIYIPIGC